MDCLFCKIINKSIPANIVYENDALLAFEDINPQAPTHILIIPKKHIATLNDMGSDDQELIGQLVHCAKRLANDLKLADDGYRLVFNTNEHGGQMVFHIHLHLLGGRAMLWPPG